jgi:hypothetical protein
MKPLVRKGLLVDRNSRGRNQSFDFGGLRFIPRFDPLLPVGQLAASLWAESISRDVMALVAQDKQEEESEECCESNRERSDPLQLVWHTGPDESPGPLRAVLG